jgi:hypothetical protein
MKLQKEIVPILLKNSFSITDIFKPNMVISKPLNKLNFLILNNHLNTSFLQYFSNLTFTIFNLNI